MTTPSKLTGRAEAYRRAGLSDKAMARIAEARARRKERKLWLKANKPRIDAEWDALPNPPRNIDAFLAEARARMGETEWAAWSRRADEEWEALP